ncbi:hypothetical protein HPB50_009426 [Hyalomma asiaticum]|uniref:Uncharacterized protein n=1 Tax=Hyalomma asiaticum TaxID=266040 RepID=A0ACB7RNZ9_HYAAI|nr:hypothetical protein HPB50_009426 [Hyalomma asiaticum]
MAEQSPAEARLPSERASPIPGGSPRSDGSAFSTEGDRTIMDIQLANADTQRQGAPDAAPPGFPPPPPTALPSGVPFSTEDSGDEVTQAAFHRAIAHQKDITDLLFDPSCKLTNQQRSKIIAHLRNILQECADIRAVAARQSGRVDELRHQLTRLSAAPSYRPALMPPADAGPAPSYASVLAGGQHHPGQQMALRGPVCPAAPPQQAQPSGFDAQPHIRQEHAHLMFLTPLVPSTSPANDLIKLIKTNIDPTKEKIGLNPPFPPFWQASPELNRHSITARLLKHFSLSPTLWIVIFPLPPRPRQLNMFYMLVSLVPKSSAAQGPTPSARLLIALPFGTSTK